MHNNDVFEQSLLHIHTYDTHGGKDYSTGFVVHQDLNYSYILSCAHGKKETSKIQINGEWAELLSIGEGGGIDLAILKIRKAQKPSLRLENINVTEDSKVICFGIQDQKTGPEIQLINGVVRKVKHKLDKNGNKFQTYAIEVIKDKDIHFSYYIADGHSGGPVIDISTQSVIGVLIADISNGEGKLGEAIAINYLNHLDKANPNLVREIFEPDELFIPEGKFLWGSDKQKDIDAFDTEIDLQEIEIPSFYLGKTPVTNSQYNYFVLETAYPAPPTWGKEKRILPGLENHPVIGVSWNDAMKYCNWLSKKTGKNYRLPTEQEWEKAARGDKDDRIFPWGNEWSSNNSANIQNNFEYKFAQPTVQVGMFQQGASPYGLLDMVGNVLEWTQTSLNDKEKILKGGCIMYPPEKCRISYRDSEKPTIQQTPIGFRVARDL